MFEYKSLRLVTNEEKIEYILEFKTIKQLNKAFDTFKRYAFNLNNELFEN